MPSENLVNCVGLIGVQSGVEQNRGQRCATVQLEAAQPHPSITKTVSGASPSGRSSGEFEPGDTVTYTLTVGNDADATGPLVAPRIVDCVPSATYLSVGNVTLGDGWTGGIVEEAGCGADSTRLVFTYTGSIEPGQSAPIITYEVTAQDYEFDPPAAPTPPGSYTNTVTATQTDGETFLHCVQASCSASRTISLLPVVRLDSIKLVRGATDSGFNIAGTTTPGGQVTYRLEVRNTGNTQVDEVEFIDIFPHIGDTGVRVHETSRGSKLSPFLVSPIEAPPGWVVEYSLSDNPCRGGVGGRTTECDAPGWTTTPDLLRLPDYRSIRLTYDQRLDIGAALSFEWKMVTPVNDPTYADGDSAYGALENCTIPVSDPPYPESPGASTLTGRTTSAPPTCPVAVNSFAYGANIPFDQLGGLPNPGRLGAEPPMVDLHVAAGPQPYVLGDRVWEDRNNDGIQGAGEPGIPFVRVELWTVVGGQSSERRATTFTDLDGEYLFEGLPGGQYRVRFYLPDHLGYPSPPNATIDGEPAPLLDSDVPEAPTGADELGNYYETATVTLDAANPVDRSWDAGLWIPEPEISIIKTVTGGTFSEEDANTAPGIHVYHGGELTPDGPVLPGDPLTFTYSVTNTGNTYLVDVEVTDRVTIPAADVGPPTPVCAWAMSSDPETPDGILSPGETVICTATDVEPIPGLYRNLGEVTAIATRHPDDPTDPDTYARIDLTGFDDAVSDDDPAHVSGVSFQVGDFVFLDVDGDGRYTHGSDLPVPLATQVQLFAGQAADHHVDAVPLASTTTSLGRYVFSNLPPGAYYVVIPGSEFAEGGSLEGFTVAPSAGTGVGANEGVDHNAVLIGDDIGGGVRSSISTPEFSVSLVGGQWVGNGPIGDGPLDPNAPNLYLGVPADRSDRTLDLAVVGLPPLELSHQVECADDAVYVRFRVDENFEPLVPTASLVFRGVDAEGAPTGPPVSAFRLLEPGVLAGAPLGSAPLGEWITVLWPEAVLDAEGVGVGWPGWSLIAGIWTQVPTDVRPLIHLAATVNPVVTAVIEYPSEIQGCRIDPPLSSVGDRVWWDQDADGSDDDGAEPGVPGASVTITWAGPDGEFGTGDDVIHPAIITDADGRYLLESLPPGRYRIAVTDLDAHFEPTYDVVNGTSAPSTSVEIILAEGEDRRDVDFGVRAPMALGDLVWLDINADGVFSPGIDVSLSGVPLELWSVGGTTPMATTTTDGEGRYLFHDLDPGSYEVRIPPTAFSAGTMLGWRSAPNGSLDPNDDVDELEGHDARDRPGGPVVGGIGTAPLTLSMSLDENGVIISGEPGTGQPGGELTNLTLDLALVAPVAIRIEKATNGVDADQPTGPFVPAGSTVTWTYVVTNTGDLPLIDVTIVDSVEGEVPCAIPLLRPGSARSVTCQLTGRARSAPAPDQYANLGTASGQPSLPYLEEGFVPPTLDVTAPLEWPTEPAHYRAITVAPSEADGPDGPTAISRVEASDPSHYLSARPAVQIEKATNGVDADTGPGPWIRTGDQVTWTYVVTNTGNTPLTQVRITDDRNVVIDCGGGSAVIARLDPDVSRTCTGFGVAGEGPYVNLGTVVAVPSDQSGAPILDPDTGSPVSTVTDDDPSHHRGANPAIDLTKQVCSLADPSGCNGAVERNWTDSIVLGPDQPAVWRITVRNTGNVTLDPVVVVDPVTPACDRELGRLAPGESARYTCVLGALFGPVINTATATGRPVDERGTPIRTAPGDVALPPVTSTDAAAASPPPRLTVDKSVSDATAQLGDPVVWTIVVVNEGHGPAHRVRVVDTLPSGLQVLGLVPGMVHDPVGNRLIADIEHMDPGERMTFTYRTVVMDGATDLVNRVEVGVLAPDGSTLIPEASDAESVVPIPVSPESVTTTTESAAEGGSGQRLPSAGADLRLSLVLGLLALVLGLVARNVRGVRRS